MSSVKVAINGFGRIGRLVFRQIYNMEGIEVVAINDLTSPAVLAHLLKYDSAQGRFEAEVKSTEDAVVVNGHAVKIYAQRDPSQIPWGAHNVDVVIESTGFFTDKEKAELHIKAGAKRVVISAPATGDMKTVVFNTNHEILDGTETVISGASALAPVPSLPGGMIKSSVVIQPSSTQGGGSSGSNTTMVSQLQVLINQLTSDVQEKDEQLSQQKAIKDSLASSMREQATRIADLEKRLGEKNW